MRACAAARDRTAHARAAQSESDRHGGRGLDNSIFLQRVKSQNVLVTGVMYRNSYPNFVCTEFPLDCNHEIRNGIFLIVNATCARWSVEARRCVMLTRATTRDLNNNHRWFAVEL